jgi:hypothetical protein
MAIGLYFGDLESRFEGSVTACNRLVEGAMRDLRYVRHEVRKAYRRLGKWRLVGAEFGISGGMAYRIGAQGYEPKEPKIRTILGLPAMVMTPVCRHCGEVHVRRRCTYKKREYRSWWDAPVEELRELIIHRIEAVEYKQAECSEKI